MNNRTRRIAEFGLLTALALVLGLIDRAVPLSALLSGSVPGLKLGLANTVLLFAVYRMDGKAAVLLMLTKVILSGFLFGSLSAMLYSFSGGVLSLAVMLGAKKNPRIAALCAAACALLSEVLLLARNPAPRGQMLTVTLLIFAALLAALGLFFLLRKKPELGVLAVSLAGAVAHNVGQVAAAALVLKTPLLLTVYLPALSGLGTAVGCLTGIVARQVLRVLRETPKKPPEAA